MKISQSKEARAIRGLFRDESLNKETLWAILSGLRGPDNFLPAYEKDAITAVIRGRLGLEKFFRSILVINTEDRELFRGVRRKFSETNIHFRKHSQDAFKALKLSWDEVNK